MSLRIDEGVMATNSDKAYMEAINAATHVYVGRKDCGCIMAVTTDIEHPRGKKDVAKDITDFLKGGMSIERMSFADWRNSKLGHTCGRSK